MTSTCGGCEYVVTEPWPRNQTALRCSAPGKYQGYVVGYDRPLPYKPAWCPLLRGDTVRNTIHYK